MESFGFVGDFSTVRDTYMRPEYVYGQGYGRPDRMYDTRDAYIRPEWASKGTHIRILSTPKTYIRRKRSRDTRILHM
jgi:hypothetical protein